MKMYNRTCFVFFMVYCIQSHMSRIKYIEFSLQNMGRTIETAKTAFSLLFLKSAFHVPLFTDAWARVMDPISETARCTPGHFSFSLAAQLNLSGTLELGMATPLSFLQWNGTRMTPGPWKPSWLHLSCPIFMTPAKSTGNHVPRSSQHKYL